MKDKHWRIFVEKKPPFDVEAGRLLRDLKENLFLENIESLRILNRYDISGISDIEFCKSKYTIFSEKTVDRIFEDEIPLMGREKVFAIEYLPGQYDQRADSASECLQLQIQGNRPKVRCAKVIVLTGTIECSDIDKIKAYIINPVDSREASLDRPSFIDESIDRIEKVREIENFILMNDSDLELCYKDRNLAMSWEDFIVCRDYFRDGEKRNPTFTELKVIDTYWSDHCRHTTFLTEIREVDFETGKYTELIKRAYKSYLDSRHYVYGEDTKPMCLMDAAVIGMKELKKRGLLEDLDLSDEINACSIKVPVVTDGRTEEWLIMFKNETHNHPTEIEPFGGAATCLGGAIRDPLSGRTYVYQAMRLSGSADPRTKIEDTIPGKLPQRRITTEAAHGYSSYGNQIGIATGFVQEVYDEGFIAKRMEVGAVIGAAPAANVKRNAPVNGDKIILLGGRTGRDGCGGATGSSKEHTEDSISNCGAEVQKGNAPIERKIQRLFRNSEVSRLIKKCNDFGAGGVSVAIGELAEGLQIFLDAIPKKYQGLSGTELAISESQERMAVVLDKDSVDKFIECACEENLEATVVGEVTDSNRLVMLWEGRAIVNISRSFLNTNGAKAYTNAMIKCPSPEDSYFHIKSIEECSLRQRWINTIQNLNVCSQKGLIERFDSTIGSGTILMPFGGKYQLTPSEGMAAIIPLLKGDTQTATIMTCGYNPKIAKWSPFHGAVYALLESISRVVAMGGDYKKIRLSLQEYFEKLGNDSSKWGKPLSALLGALLVQKEFGTAAIGGKDSMSGSFNNLHVPPTLAAFAVCVAEDCSKIISPELKSPNNKILLLRAERDDFEMPDFTELKCNFEKVHKLAVEGKLMSACTVKSGGICEAISKMAFGNKVGFKFENSFSTEELFTPDYGSILIEISNDVDIAADLDGLNYKTLGTTISEPEIIFRDMQIHIDEMITLWEKPLESIFSVKTVSRRRMENHINCGTPENRQTKSLLIKRPMPKVFIPVFPGTNCEYDSTRAFEKAGADVSTFVFRNLSPVQIEESVESMEREIRSSQIIMLPGGFSAGDEPDGSGKFIATVFRNPRIKEAVMRLLKDRDGLILGICNGFQALIKLGLVPYGEITDIHEDSPTLTYNEIGRHVSCMINTKVVSKLSPWFNNVDIGDIHTIPVSHGEGRFIARDEVVRKLFENGQVAAQYVDLKGIPSLEMPYNPNGSYYAIESITSPDGKVLGKMAHSERTGQYIHKNTPGNKEQKIFEAGVNYFK